MNRFIHRLGVHMSIFFVFMTCLFQAAFAGGQQLKVSDGQTTKSYSVQQLLARKDLQPLIVKKDPAYEGQRRTYKAVPVTALFEGLSVAPDAVIQFRALDGFSAPLPKERLLNKNMKKSRAFIAVEDPKKPWPHLGKGKPSAGPFYLVWQNPELSDVGTEEWPFMLAALEVKGSFGSLYPQIFPDSKLPEDNPVRKGFRLFTKNCFACHTLNKVGSSHLGPDLNVPQSPTEYLKSDALVRLIRNPQNLRHWPESKMKGFSKEELSDQDIQQIILYLKHMASRRVLN